MALLVLILLTILTSHSLLSAAALENDLVAAAKREGEVTYYTVVSPTAEVPIIQGFNKRYPFLKVNHYRAGQSALVERILQEARAGRYPDVVTNNFFQLLTLVDNGILESYDFPERKSVRKGFVDPDGRFAAIGITPFAVSYNSRNVKPQELPKRYEEFLDPKWKGELALIPQVGWGMSMLDALGEKKGEAFLRSLAKHNVRVNSGNSLQLQLLSAGEFKLGVSNIVYLTANLKAKGAPVDFAYIDPVYADFTGTGLVAKASHKSAGKLFLRYLFSEEAQTLYRDSGRVVGRVDVPHSDRRVTEGITLHPYKAAWLKDFDKVQKLVDTLFGRAS